MASTTASINRTITVGSYNYYLVFSATFTTSGTSSVSAKLTNSSAYSLTYNLNSSWNMSNNTSGTYKLGTLTGGETKTLFSTSTAFNSGSVSTTFDFYGQSFTISATLGSDAVAATLQFENTSVKLGETHYVTISGGKNVTTKLYLKVGSTSIDTALTASGYYYFNPDTLASLFATSADATFHLYSYSNGSQIGDSAASFTLTKGATISFKDFYSITIDRVNNYIIAGTSKIEFRTIIQFTYPDSGTTISSVDISSKYPDADLGTPEYITDVSSTSDTCTIRSVLSNAFPIPEDRTITQYKTPEYTITVTDNQGTTITYTIGSTYVVYCYITPVIESVEVHRCDSSGTTLPSGEYAYATVKVKEATAYTVTEAKFNINSTDYSLSTSDNLTFSGIVGDGNLNTSTQYQGTFSIRTADMKTYNDTVWVSQSTLLPTMQLPISLYDDTDQVGVSFGEMAQKYSNVSGESVVNFAQGLTLRATSVDDGTVATKDAYELLTLAGGRNIFVQTTTTIPEGMSDGDILIVYEE